MTAKPGKGDELVEVLLSGPTTGPAAHEGCTVFLVGRSAANPDVVHLTEGWVSEAVHAEVFASARAQAYTARVSELLTAAPDVRVTELIRSDSKSWDD